MLGEARVGTSTLSSGASTLSSGEGPSMLGAEPMTVNRTCSLNSPAHLTRLVQVDKPQIRRDAVIGSSLSDAIEKNVFPGDTVHVMLGHSRWTALARELVRQYWRSDPGFTLVMTSLGALGGLFFSGGLLRKVVTSYSGNSFPTYAPNPIFRSAYESGQVEVEHWSILSLSQRMEAAARGLPAVVTGSIKGSSMAQNAGYSEVESAFGQLSLLAPLAPDVALLHAAAADRAGNLIISEPMLEGVWGAWAARRGVVATVERIVDDFTGMGQRVRIPAHRVLAVVQAPFGAHPGGCYAPGIPVHSYGEDIGHWIEAAKAARGDFEQFARKFALEPKDQESYLGLFGDAHLKWLEGRSNPDSWIADAEATPVPVAEAVSDWEIAAAFGAREVERVVQRYDADAVLAGAGVANLAAWVAVARMRVAGGSAGGSSRRPPLLTAELGMLGYVPTPADPYIFNHRVFPNTPFLSDASTVLGMLVGGGGSKVVGCLGAAEVDREGNLNSTQLAGNRFLVGSGGGNDVGTRADACVVVTLAQPFRLPEEVGYITTPGTNVVSIVTDKGILRRVDGVLRIAVVPGGDGSIAERVRKFSAHCGWDPQTFPEVEELNAVEESEVLALREFDRERLFLS